MMTKEEYLANPCKASSLPFWKTQTVIVPKNMKIIRDDLLDRKYQGDKQYFKLIHYLKDKKITTLPNGFVVYEASTEEFASHINQCYEEEHIEASELEEYKKHKVYNSNLWIALKDTSSNKIVATIIGEVDDQIKEGTIEWVQVSKEYRRKGLGTYLINSLLEKMRDKAHFVTVSGRIDNSSNPLKLYMSCGFENPVIWHIINE